MNDKQISATPSRVEGPLSLCPECMKKPIEVINCAFTGCGDCWDDYLDEFQRQIEEDGAI